MDKWENCIVDYNIEDMFQVLPVYMGLDFGFRRDFTSLAVICRDPKTKKIYVKCHTWITQSEIEEQPNVPFADWQRDGYFEPDIFDYFDPNMLNGFLHRIVKRYKQVNQLGYDKYMIGAEMSKFDDEVPFDCVEVQNSFAGINEAASDFYHHVVTENVGMEKSELLNWCAGNVFVRKSPQGQG